MKKYTTAKMLGMYQLRPVDSEGFKAAKNLEQLGELCHQAEQDGGAIEHWNKVELRKLYGALIDGLTHREVIELGQIRRRLLSTAS